MLRCQFLSHILKAIFFIKLALKLSYFCKKMQNFRALGAPPPDLRASGSWGLCTQTPSLRQVGASPPDPQTWPPSLRISGYALDHKCATIDKLPLPITFFHVLTKKKKNATNYLSENQNCEVFVGWHHFVVLTLNIFFASTVVISK